MLRFEHVSLAYGARSILRDVSFAIERGERVAIVGPSGAGKTTAFRLAYAAFAPTAGRVMLAGEDLAVLRGPALRAARARIAVVFQAHGLVERLRVWQNVVAGTFGRRGTVASLRAVARLSALDRPLVLDALERVGLASRLDARTSDLSGGERQRIAIARAIVQRAELVLADEPAASLDPALGSTIVDALLADARARGAALVCALHQPQLAERFDRILRVADGRVEETSDAWVL